MGTMQTSNWGSGQHLHGAYVGRSLEEDAYDDADDCVGQPAGAGHQLCEADIWEQLRRRPSSMQAFVVVFPVVKARSRRGQAGDLELALPYCEVAGTYVYVWLLC